MIMSSVSGVMATAQHSLEMMQACSTDQDGDDDGIGQHTCESALTTAALITAGVMTIMTSTPYVAISLMDDAYMLCVFIGSGSSPSICCYFEYGAIMRGCHVRNPSDDFCPIADARQWHANRFPCHRML
jgi:hypothetical protein